MALSVFLWIFTQSSALPLARVNGVPISPSQLERFQSKEDPLESAVLFELALQEARREGLDKKEAFQKKSEELLYQLYLEKNLKHFSSTELKKEYERKPLFHLYHLRVTGSETAKAVSQYLAQGKAFSHAVVHFSQEENSKTGGRLEYRGPHNLPALVYQALIKAKPGETLGPLPDAGDFHFVQFIRKIPWVDLPESIRIHWSDEFIQLSNQNRLKEILANLRKKANVEYGKKK